MYRDILFDPALVNLLKEAKMFIAALDIQTKSNDPQNQADECRIPTASKKFKFLAKENHKLAHRPMSGSFLPSIGSLPVLFVRPTRSTKGSSRENNAKCNYI